MSGNGTRIAAAWLAEQTGRTSDHGVGRRARACTRGCSATGSSSRISGPCRSASPSEVDGIRFTPVDVGNPHAVVEGDPAELGRDRPAARDGSRAFPNRTNVQVARRLDADDDRGAGLGARGGRDRSLGDERGRDRRRARRRPRRRCAFPAATCRCGSRTAVRWLTGPAERDARGEGHRERCTAPGCCCLAALAARARLRRAAAAAPLTTYTVPTRRLLARPAAVLGRRDQGRDPPC